MRFLTNFWNFYDPTKPKSKKCKESSTNKVAQTEKALAKARVEKEAAKKAKVAPSIEVNIPRVKLQGEGTALSLHSSDFIPGNTPLSLLLSDQ